MFKVHLQQVGLKMLFTSLSLLHLKIVAFA